MEPIPVSRTDVRLLPDASRVIARLFVPGDQVFPDGRSRIELIVDRILGLPDDILVSTLEETYRGFAGRHANLRRTFERHFDAVSHRVAIPGKISAECRQLIGAYFTHEYAIESAALGNPSIVPAPNQSGLEPGAQRFIASLRAVGEGHVSSIEFRSGVIDANLNVTIDEPSGYADTGTPTRPSTTSMSSRRSSTSSGRRTRSATSFSIRCHPTSPASSSTTRCSSSTGKGSIDLSRAKP